MANSEDREHLKAM